MLVGLVIIVVLALIAVGLFLPPFSIGEHIFSTPFTALNQQSPSAGADGLMIAVDPAHPGTDYGVRVGSIPLAVYTGRSAASADDAAWIRAARAAQPTSLTLVSPVYEIAQQGTSGALTLTVSLPKGADSRFVDLYDYDVQDNRWQFVPAHPSTDGAALVATVKTPPDRLAIFQTAPLAPVISSNVDIGQTLTPALVNLSNAVHPAGLQPTDVGTLQGVLPAGIELNHGYAVIPVIRNFGAPTVIDVTTIATVLQSSSLRTAHIQRLAEFASSKAYQGLSIDYRLLPAAQRANFTTFITALAEKLHSAKRTLTVVVPFPAQSGSSFDTGAYDWQAIGAAADNVQLLLPVDPQTFVQKGLVDNVLQWAVGEINRARLQVVISLLSVQDTDGMFSPIAYSDAVAPLGQVVVAPSGSVSSGSQLAVALSGYSAQFMPPDSSGTPSIKYFSPDGKLVATMWLTTDAVIANRLSRAATFHLAGAALIDIAAPGVAPSELSAVSAFKLNQQGDASTAKAALALRWMVVNGTGQILAQATSLPGTPFGYTVGMDSNQIQFNVEVVGAQATFSSAPIVVISVTPTSMPSATPLPPTSPPATVGPPATAKS